MTAIRSELQNAYETSLTQEMLPNALTAEVQTKGALTSPCYLVIEPDSDTQREYILFDGAFGASSFVTTGIGNRYLAGSAAGSNLTHPSGAVVRCVPLAQHVEDLHDRIDAGFNHGALTGLGDDDHPLYPLLDGSRGFSGPVVVGEPTVATEAATKSYVDAQVAGGIPAGVIMAFGAAAAPGGYLLCDGAEVSRTVYADLYAVVGDTYGVGNGTTTFNLPDLQQRFPIGKAAAGTASTLGETGGSIDHAHSLAAHDHGYTIPDHNHSIASHTHTMAHVHDVGSHTHVVNPSNHYTSYALDGVDQGTGTADNTHYNYKIASEHADHRHTVDISATTSGVPSGGSLDTEGSSASNTGSSSGAVGSHGFGALTTAKNSLQSSTSHNPPYLVVNYIIKT